MQENAYLITLSLLVGMPLAMEVGRRVRIAKIAGAKGAPDGAEETGVGALDAAVYALFGLLLAFIFSGAATRFDDRRELIAQEANAIGTAYLRADLLPQATQDALRPLFQRYLESRIAMHQHMEDAAATRTEYARSQAIQNEIWEIALDGARETGNPAVLTLVLQSLNDMIDITTTRFAATLKHPPPIIYAMLVIVAFAASFLSGMAMAKSRVRPWPHILAFTLVISATTFVILDVEYPRRGFIQIDTADQVLIELLDHLR